MTRTKPNTQKNSVQFTRQTIHEISTDINEALKIIAEKYGMAKMSLGSISFDSTSFSGRLTAFSGRLTADATTPDYDFEKEIETVDKIPNFNLAKINELMKYVEKDSVTSTQNGIYYDSNATKLVANDRYTMKYIDSLMGGHDFIIHAESIKELNKLSKLEHLSNVFLLKDNKMKFMFENIVYICDLIVGKYLPWSSVIPNYANGYLISISPNTIDEINKFSETIMNTRKSLKLKKITIQVHFDLKENKINIYDIETDMQKTWNFKSKFQDCPTNHCGVIMPIQISEDDMEFVLDSELLLKVSSEDLFFGEKNSAILLIPKTNE